MPDQHTVNALWIIGAVGVILIILVLAVGTAADLVIAAKANRDRVNRPRDPAPTWKSDTTRTIPLDKTDDADDDGGFPTTLRT